MIRVVAFAILSVYWGGLFVGTHLPRGVRGLGQIDDKLLHFGAYVGLAFLLAAALTSLGGRSGALLLTMLVACVYGALDELSQIPIPGRHCDIADWAANVFGAGVGVAAFALLIVTSRWCRGTGNPQANGYERC